MDYLNQLDYIVIFIYFSFLVGLGLYLKKMASASLEDYFLGGRKLPWWAMGISGMASWLDITGTMVITSFLFMLGPRGIFIELRGGVGLIMVVMLLWTGKWHRRSGCMTGAEWMKFRFGEGFGGQFARIFSAIAQTVFTVGMLAYMVKGVGLFLSMFLNMPPLYCAIIMIGIAAVYTMASGFYGVVFTDIFQSGVILIAVITITVLATAKVVDSQSLDMLAQKVTGNSDWMKITPYWKTQMPKGYEVFQNLGMFAVFYLLQNLFMGAGMGDDPKYFGARNDRECGLLSFLWSTLMVFRWPLMMGLAILGLFLVKEMFPDPTNIENAALVIKENLGEIAPSRWADVIARITKHPSQYPMEMISSLQEILGQQWQDKLQLVSSHGTVNPERIVPAVLIHNIPRGFRGLILIALIAASMSTFDSTVNAATGFFTRDIYQRYLRPKAANKELIYASWLYILGIVIIGFLFGYTVESINDIWSWVIAGFWGGMVVPRFLRFYWWRFNGGGFAFGTAFGLSAAVLQRIIAPALDPRLTFLLTVAFGFIGSVIGTFISPQTSNDVLQSFYKTTRPFGFWKPMKKLLTEQETKIMKKEHRNDLLALPFTICWHISWLIWPMMLLIHNYKGFAGVAAVCLTGLAGMYVFWYRNLPKENFYEETNND